MRNLVRATHDYSVDIEEFQVVSQKARIPFHKPGAQ
jgi:hypothetical protein